MKIVSTELGIKLDTSHKQIAINCTSQSGQTVQKQKSSKTKDELGG